MSRLERRLHAAITLLLVAGILVFGGLLAAGKLEVRTPGHDRDGSGAENRQAVAGGKDGTADQKGGGRQKGGDNRQKGGDNRQKGGDNRQKGEEGPVVLPAQTKADDVSRTIRATYAVTYEMRDAHAIWCCVCECRSPAGTEVISFSSGHMLAPGDRLTLIWLDAPLSRDRTEKEVPVGYWSESHSAGVQTLSVPGKVWEAFDKGGASVRGGERRSASLKAQVGNTVPLCQYGVARDGFGGAGTRDLPLSKSADAFFPLPVYPEGTPGCTIRWTLLLKFVNPDDWKDPEKQAELRRFYDGKVLVEGVRERLIQERLQKADQAIAKNPDDAAALNDLAWIRSTCSLVKYRDGKSAVQHAARACELSKEPAYRVTLAAAYAEAGEFDKAVETQEKVMGGDQLAQHQLTLYKERKPWRE
jgi:hypothetical protein